MESGEGMSREQIWELEESKRILLQQAYRMKQEHPHMSPVGLEHEMYLSIIAEEQDWEPFVFRQKVFIFVDRQPFLKGI